MHDFFFISCCCFFTWKSNFDDDFYFHIEKYGEISSLTATRFGPKLKEELYYGFGETPAKKTRRPYDQEQSSLELSAFGSSEEIEEQPPKHLIKEEFHPSVYVAMKLLVVVGSRWKFAVNRLTSADKPMHYGLVHDFFLPNLFWITHRTR